MVTAAAFKSWHGTAVKVLNTKKKEFLANRKMRRTEDETEEMGNHTADQGQYSHAHAMRTHYLAETLRLRRSETARVRERERERERERK